MDFDDCGVQMFHPFLPPPNGRPLIFVSVVNIHNNILTWYSSTFNTFYMECYFQTQDQLCEGSAYLKYNCVVYGPIKHTNHQQYKGW